MIPSECLCDSHCFWCGKGAPGNEKDFRVWHDALTSAKFRRFFFLLRVFSHPCTGFHDCAIALLSFQISCPESCS